MVMRLLWTEFSSFIGKQANGDEKEKKEGTKRRER